MHGVPENLDTGVFVGATLELICFAAYQVDLHFESDERLSISVEGTYVHAGPEQEGWMDEGHPPIEQSRLMQLANHAVVEAARLDSQRLRLVFDHGHSLTLIDDTDQYESFQIEARGQRWII